jgi:alpha-galactosidase
MKHCLVVLTFLLLNAFHAFAAESDISGAWLLREPNADGTERKQLLKLTQQGNKVAGTVVYNYRPIEITEGTVDGPHFHFVVGRSNRKRSFDGSLETDHLAIKELSADGKTLGQGTATRSSEDAMAPPKPLPLPSLHNLPDNGLARTPPMGWNSWNHFHRLIDDKTVREIADAIVSTGMKDAGYVYVNIDDTWERGRDAQGNITLNNKFPDMKALADYVHSKGLKIGIYSSPGPTTCAAYEGSFGHEEADANMYAKWGIDYLKYDWCSASAVYKDADMQAVYQVMGDALRKSNRPIVFSLCQYGREDVWKWGAQVSGNLWRTTGDISDNWTSMSTIGFKQLAIAPYAKIGHWNDPDMLEIGNGGMNDDEYRTHMALWAMLRAPLLAGNDIRSMSDATKAILLNKEVIAIDQDRKGEPAQLLKADGPVEIWTRPLERNATAIAFFNKGEQASTVTLTWAEAKLKKRKKARDLWSHSDVKLAANGIVATLPAHGSALFRFE